MDPNNTPALEPPPGVKSNLVDPYSQQSTLIVVSIVCIVLCTIGVAARFYTRLAVFKQFDTTDGALLLSLMLFIAFMAVQIVAGENGQGSHQWDVSEAAFARLLRNLNIIEVIYGPTMFFAKYVVLRQIETIFLQHRRQSAVYKVIWGLIWANLIFYAAITISFICACVPREKIWHPDIPGRCLDTQKSIIATSAINVVSDITILFVPLVGVWQLQLPLKRKFGAAAVFAVGVFATVASVIRLYFSVKLTQTEDLTWAITPVACWALAEFTTVLLVACFPFIPRLIKHFRKRETGSQVHSSYNTSSKDTYRSARRFEALELRDGSSTTALREPSTEHKADEIRAST